MSDSTVTAIASTPTSAKVTTRASTGSRLSSLCAPKKARLLRKRDEVGANCALRSVAASYRALVTEDPRRRIGRRGEEIAARALERLGYRIVDRNFRTREGELDLVAARGGTLVFCEVKALVARPGGPGRGPASPLEAVGPAKRVQVRRLARAWLAARDRRTARELRFDVVGVTLSSDGETLRVDHLQ